MNKKYIDISMDQPTYCQRSEAGKGKPVLCGSVHRQEIRLNRLLQNYKESTRLGNGKGGWTEDTMETE